MAYNCHSSLDLRRGLFDAGDQVMIYSASADGWVNAHVVQLKEGADMAMVEFNVQGKRCRKLVHLCSLRTSMHGEESDSPEEEECDPDANFACIPAAKQTLLNDFHIVSQSGQGGPISKVLDVTEWLGEEHGAAPVHNAFTCSMKGGEPLQGFVRIKYAPRTKPTKPAELPDYVLKVHARPVDQRNVKENYQEVEPFFLHTLLHSPHEDVQFEPAIDGRYILGLTIHKDLSRDLAEKMRTNEADQKYYSALIDRLAGSWNFRNEPGCEQKAAQADYLISYTSHDKSDNDDILDSLRDNGVPGPHSPSTCDPRPIRFCTDRSLGFGCHFYDPNGEVTTLSLGKHGFAQPIAGSGWWEEYAAAAQLTRFGILILPSANYFSRSDACFKEFQHITPDRQWVYDRHEHEIVPVATFLARHPGLCDHAILTYAQKKSNFGLFDIEAMVNRITCGNAHRVPEAGSLLCRLIETEGCKEITEHQKLRELVKSLTSLADRGDESAFQALAAIAKRDNPCALQALAAMVKRGDQTALQTFVSMAKEGNEPAIRTLRELPEAMQFSGEEQRKRGSVAENVPLGKKAKNNSVSNDANVALGAADHKDVEDVEDAKLRRLGNTMEQEGLIALTFLGNPGAGKSTLANCLAGYKLFEASSSATGTKRLQYAVAGNGRVFIDTPGLADLTQRKQTASAITKALKLGGQYRICFLVSLRGGRRLMEEDVTTMNEMLAAIAEVEKNQFGVIVNQCARHVLKSQLKQDEIANVLLQRSSPSTSHVFFAPWIDELQGASGEIIAPLESKLRSFVDHLPVICLVKHRAGLQGIYKGIYKGVFGHVGAIYATFTFQKDGTLYYEHEITVSGILALGTAKNGRFPGQYTVSQTVGSSKQVEWKGVFIDELATMKAWAPPPADYPFRVLLPGKVAFSNQGDALTFVFTVEYDNGEKTEARFYATRQ